MESTLADSTSGPDFLLSSSVFHQQASSLFSSSSPLSSYFTSLWLQELPEDKRGSLKRLSTNICPHCGTQRSPDNVQVRVKSRKRRSRKVSRLLSKQEKRAEESSELEEFQQSKNCISYRCEVCKKEFAQPGITRFTQKELKKKAIESKLSTALPSKEIFVVNTPKSLPKSSFQKLPVTASSTPSLSGKKRKVKDANAGLVIPASISSFKKALNSPAGLNLKASDNQPAKSLLDRFLL